jgi:L-ascorbate metabolism protein UlaG (beta-lactamase superfamily)
MKIYIGGDSGYDSHFADISQQFGPFDLAILECGQYNKSWKYIHMMPEELIQAGQDLKTRKIMPVHWSKFTLALHSWNDPITRVITETKKKDFPIIHPMIGEEVILKNGAESVTW